MDVNYLGYASAVNQMGDRSQGLAQLGQGIDQLQANARQRQMDAMAMEQNRRAASLADLQMQQGNLNLAQDKAASLALIGQYGTGDRPDFQTQLADATAFQGQEKQDLTNQEAARKIALEKVKTFTDTFKSFADAVHNDTMDADAATKAFPGLMKHLGMDYSQAGISFTFGKGGGYYSGPIKGTDLIRVNGQDVPYGAAGIVEKARVVGIGADGKTPIYEIDKDTTFKEAEADKRETWSEPYMSTVGGKKVMLQKSSTGQIRPVVQDASTTVKVDTGHGGQSNDYSNWSKGEKLWWFENQKATGQRPDLGTGRSAAAARQQYTREYAAWNRGEGVSGAEAATQGESFKADSKSLANQQKSRGMMGSFVRNLNKQVDRVDVVANDLVSRVGVRALDLPLRELKTRFRGDANEKILEAYMTEISNEIGKLSTGSSASVAELSVEAQKKWAKIHDTNLSINQIRTILKETKDMGQMRLASSDEEIKATQQRMRGASGAGKVAPAVDYFKANAGKYSQKALYDQLRAQGWKHNDIVDAWTKYRGK